MPWFSFVLQKKPGLLRFVYLVRLLLFGFGFSAHALFGIAAHSEGVSSCESKPNPISAQISFLDTRPDTLHTSQFPLDRLPVAASVVMEAEEEEVRSSGESFDLDAPVASGITGFIFRNSLLHLNFEVSDTFKLSSPGLPDSGRSRHTLYQIFRL